jgi:hypothetical protein
VSFANTSFFAGDQAGEIYTSATGASWVGPTAIASVSSSIMGVSYANEKYLLAPSSGNLQWSSDGATWTTCVTPKDMLSVASMCVGEGRFAILTNNAGLDIYTGSNIFCTPDGNSWLLPSPVLQYDSSHLYTAIQWVPFIEAGGAFIVTQS